MDCLIDVVIPTYVSAHLFWIIPKRDLLLRSAMSKIMERNRPGLLKGDHISENNMVAVNVDHIWARAIVESITEPLQPQYICWLPDYGVKRVVNYVSVLPDELKHHPHIARQASLHNVVNLMTNLCLGTSGYECQLKKTVNSIEGITRVALDFVEGANKTMFSIVDKDEFNLYGDIICVKGENHEESLTKFLINQNALGIDEEMFQDLDSERMELKESYFKLSRNWQELDNTGRKNLKEIVFNSEINKMCPSMEFFKRKSQIRNH